MTEQLIPWHPVALGIDVPAGTTRAVILDGHELALWRGGDGMIRAWQDRCPHRGMRLSFGFVRGDGLNCLYHGWTYDGAAHCTRIPAHPDLDVPKTIRATAYDVREQDGLVWTSLLQNPGEPVPAAGTPASPVLTLAVAVGADTIRERLGLGRAAVLGRLDETVIIALHSVSPEKCLLHGLLRHADATPAERLAAARALRAFRSALETHSEAA